jgi:hypothetical protein
VLDIELAGTALQQFDTVKFTGDAILGGQLHVSLINGFQLQFSQKFKILDITGKRTGMLDGLGEGAIVGNYGGKELFVTYLSGDGNDVALFTVPEPPFGWLALASTAFLLPHCRRRTP